MLLTFQEVMDSEVSNVTSSSPDDPQFALYVKEAVTRISMRGDWPGLVVPIRTCVRDGCITWPRHVQHVRKIADCRGQFPMHGMFYDWLDWRNRSWYSDGYWDGLDRGWRARRNIVNQGWSPVFSNVCRCGQYVRMYHQYAEDLGATVTIFGLDGAGNRLRTRNTDGITWSDGVTLTAQFPYAQTPVLVSHIERGVKSKTQGNLTLFAVAQSTASTAFLGYVYNVDNSTWVSLTIVMSGLGFPTLQLGIANPPVQGQNIGLLYNYDLGVWQNVVAHGATGGYYLEFGGTPSASAVEGTSAFNVDLQAWQSIVLRGTAQNAQYLDINDPNAVAPTTTYTLQGVAEYEPSETNPRYAKMQLHAGIRAGRVGEVILPGQTCMREVVALVKLRQLPISSPNDLVVLPPEALPALKEMVQAITAGESSDANSKGNFTLSSIEMMNRILEDWMPDEQIPVMLGEMGRCSYIGRQQCF